MQTAPICPPSLLKVFFSVTVFRVNAPAMALGGDRRSSKVTNSTHTSKA
jgi:hypothetical protein